MPLFSIVIPTRNRAALLRAALQSALAQTFDDYEVVISDNNSTDDTADVVRAVGKGRVRYVGTGRDLSMRDSWEFALRQARGEWVTILPDDDGVRTRLLTRVAAILRGRPTRLLQWTGATYFDASWPQAERRNTLLVPTFTRRIVELDSREALCGLFSFRGDRIPTFANSVCHRSILERVLRHPGKIFYGYCPDYSGSCVMLTQVPSYLFLDEVLSVGGATNESTGMTGRYRRGLEFTRAHREHERGLAPIETPLSVRTITNYNAKTLLQLKGVLPAELASYDVDWIRYFVCCHFELLEYERVGEDATQEREEFLRVLSVQPTAVQRAVRRSIQTERRRRVTGPLVVHCQQSGIVDILGCLAYLESQSVTLRGVAKAFVLSVFPGRRGLRVARRLGRLAERCGLGARREV